MLDALGRPARILLFGGTSEIGLAIVRKANFVYGATKAGLRRARSAPPSQRPCSMAAMWSGCHPLLVCWRPRSA
jgi:hypothetical protein